MKLADARRGAFDPVAEPLVFLPELLAGQGDDLDLLGVGLDLILEFADLGGVVAFALPLSRASAAVRSRSRASSVPGVPAVVLAAVNLATACGMR